MIHLFHICLDEDCGMGWSSGPWAKIWSALFSIVFTPPSVAGCWFWLRLYLSVVVVCWDVGWRLRHLCYFCTEKDCGMGWSSGPWEVFICFQPGLHYFLIFLSPVGCRVLMLIVVVVSVGGSCILLGCRVTVVAKAVNREDIQYFLVHLLICVHPKRRKSKIKNALQSCPGIEPWKIV
jgi:hypothetical protein